MTKQYDIEEIREILIDNLIGNSLHQLVFHGCGQVAEKLDIPNPETPCYGWLRCTMQELELKCWGRWAYKLKLEFFWHKYHQTPIPQISFHETSFTNSVFMEIVQTLDAIPVAQWDETNKGWIYFEYLCDWLLWSFGHKSFKDEPKEPYGCEGASTRLAYVAKRLIWFMVAFPFDYLGEILHSSDLCRSNHFFVLSDHEAIESDIGNSLDADIDKSARYPIPRLDSGRLMLHLSNHFINICGQDIHPTLLKICQVQSYLYAPWVIEPVRSIKDDHGDFFWNASFSGYMATCNNIAVFSNKTRLTDQIGEFKPDIGKTSKWFDYSPFCIVEPRFDITLLDPLVLNTGLICKKQ